MNIKMPSTISLCPPSEQRWNWSESDAWNSSFQCDVPATTILFNWCFDWARVFLFCISPCVTLPVTTEKIKAVWHSNGEISKPALTHWYLVEFYFNAKIRTNCVVSLPFSRWERRQPSSSVRLSPSISTRRHHRAMSGRRNVMLSLFSFTSLWANVPFASDEPLNDRQKSLDAYLRCTSALRPILVRYVDDDRLPRAVMITIAVLLDFR